MAKNNRCGGCGRRNFNNNYGCLSCVGGRRRWDNYPYFDGVCPDANGEYDCDQDNGRDRCRCDRDNGRDRCRRERRRRGDEGIGIFTAMLPMVVAPNGVIPLVNGNCFCAPGGFPVNSGLITVEEEGTYLATYTMRVPEGQTVATTLTLNVNDASQSSAVAEIGGVGPNCFAAQTIFDVCDHATVALRSSEAICLTETSAQPLVTLSLVKL